VGFYLRKSLSVGPFRFNLSKSGVGLSTGIKGFRITSLNMAEPKFEWMPPTGSKDGIDISFKNVGGLVQLTHAEVRSGNVDTPLPIPGGKISSGETIRLHFKPPVEDQIYPMILFLQFRDCSHEICECRVRCERIGEKFRPLG